MVNVYLVTNTINQKRYVGITTKTIEYRWKGHCKNASRGSQVSLHRAIRKHGKDAFEIMLVCETDSWKDACDVEVTLIAELHTHVSEGLGYNMTRGGDGVIDMPEESKSKLRESLAATNTLPETKARRSAAQKNRPPVTEETRKRLRESLIGQKRTTEQRQKMSDIAKQRTLSKEHRMKIADSKRGKPLSVEHRKKIGDKSKGHVVSDETRQKIRDAKVGKPVSEKTRKNISESHKKRIEQVSPDGVVIAMFSSITEAHEKTGVNAGHICQCCKGKYRRAGGFCWRYCQQDQVTCDSSLVREDLGSID